MSGNGTDLGHIVAMLGTVIETQHQMQLDARATQAELRELRSEYHSSVLGHGVLISDLEDRVRRIEEHLQLPPAA